MDRVFPKRILLVSAVLMVHFAQAAAPQSASPEKAKPAGLQEALRLAVTETRSKLGTLQPWQQLLFTSEVLPYPENFVREYRPQGASYKVDVDEAMLRNYLAFFGPKALGTDQPQFLFRVEAQPDCAPCSEAVPSIRRLVESRMSTRGIRLIWVKDGELPPKSVLPRSTSELPSLALLQTMQEARGTQGAVVLRAERATQKDDESGLELHKEDSKFRLIFGFSGGKIAETRSLEYQATDSTEQSSRRLVLEAMSAIGAKFLEQNARETSKALNHAGPEVLLKVSGVQDYFVISQLKSQLQLTLGDLSPVLERRLSRGRCVLALRTKLSGKELRSKLNGVTLGAAKLVIHDVLESESGMELEAEVQ